MAWLAEKVGHNTHRPGDYFTVLLVLPLYRKPKRDGTGMHLIRFYQWHTCKKVISRVLSPRARLRPHQNVGPAPVIIF
jgi:hypothetical protein